jgi:hypothetical protein
VTSKRQRAANRANSGKSTGPRSKAGKSAAKLNARLHGLATAVQSEPGADAEIESLARAISDEAGRRDLIEFARRIAEAELDLRRIRRARVTLAKLPSVTSTSIRSVATPNTKRSEMAARHENQRNQSSLADLVLRLQGLISKIDAPDRVEASRRRGVKRDVKPEVLERYERRATSRRKSAIRQFDALSRSEKSQGVLGGA